MASRAEQAATWLSGQQEAMESALASLVEVNSFTDNPQGGRQVGLIVRDLMALPDVNVAVCPSERFADHLLFRTHADHSNHDAVALVGHLDTVFPPGTFEGYRREGPLARGPGVLDMKGGLVVIAFAIRALARTGGLGSIVPLRCVVVSDEEIGSPEGQGIISAAIAGSSACLVFEAGRVGDAIITRRKGVGALTARAQGRAAHAGNSHREGANAVWALARFTDAVQSLTDYDRGVTVNVGRFSGGHTQNTVPDFAQAEVDFRFLTRADGDALVAAVSRAAVVSASTVGGTRIDVTGGVVRWPLEKSRSSAALLAEYAACAQAYGLGGGEAPLIGGGSDASTASALGVPAIDGLGPRGSGFHTRDECVEIASLVPKAQALARFLAERQQSDSCASGAAD